MQKKRLILGPQQRSENILIYRGGFFRALSQGGILSIVFTDLEGGKKAINNMLLFKKGEREHLIEELKKIYFSQKPTSHTSVATHDKPHPRVLDYFKK